MKKILVLSALLSFNAFAGIQIISDLDDTIKITNSGDLVESVGYATARKEVYAGIPEFLAGTRSYVNGLTVVSSSPEILKGKVVSLMEKHQIQHNDVILNSNFNRPDHMEYKTGAIKKVIDSTTDQFILMGDDVGDDPEIYDNIIKEYPDRILASYIHIVKNRAVPASAVKYFTTYELALKEYNAGRLEEKVVRDVALKVLSDDDDFESVFPEFAYCPTQISEFGPLNDPKFNEENILVVGALIWGCRYDRIDD
ncbi:phosphatase domain-containing protein [Peredibacter starrii]|uniref:Phosphatase domain-containing protein n=1 Tax=Peredibacter starrii TaxID=28202 RepID=A0AAX4HP93_9BACT|nr:phosphatase domain-containing protein [Peredibacter starrii]WPU64938.1 phosphatase domain-containing protein [Peredibacter starrii]